MYCYQIYHSLVLKTNFSFFWDVFRSLGAGKIIIHQWYSTSLWFMSKSLQCYCS